MIMRCSVCDKGFSINKGWEEYKKHLEEHNKKKIIKIKERK